MSLLRSSPNLNILGIFAAVIVVGYLTTRSSSPSSSSSTSDTAMSSRDSSAAGGDGNPIGGLHVSLRQPSSGSPASVIATVTNNNADPVTVLTYESPLDSLALQLGILSITPEGAAGPLDLPVMMANRVWPPQAESLVTIEPGASAENEISLENPMVKLQGAGKASVSMKGKWTAVWTQRKDGISAAALDKAQAGGGAFSGEFLAEGVSVSLS